MALSSSAVFVSKGAEESKLEIFFNTNFRNFLVKSITTCLSVLEKSLRIIIFSLLLVMSVLITCIKSLQSLCRSKPCGENMFLFKNKVVAALLPNEKLTAELNSVTCEPTSLEWLFRVSPAFPIDASKVTVIHTPSEFYLSLLKKIKSSKKRISLASLYLGTGKLENQLVDAISGTIEASEGKIKVNVLLDYMRGSRGKLNSREMFRPLLDGKFGDSCTVHLYHTPKLKGLLKAVIPNRFNELIGLQHMKLYIFDDTLIISGANLSNDYFTNRQDRYFMIENCKDLCNFYCDLMDKVSEFSFALQKDGSVTYSKKMKYHPFECSNDEFTKEASEKIRHFFFKEMRNRMEINKNRANQDTWAFPLIQMNQLDIRHDSEVTLKLLQSAPVDAVLRIATGYFNLTSDYRNAIIKQCKAYCHFLTAHPKANGFFGAQGIAGGIPAAYTKIEKSFFDLCEKSNQAGRIKLYEFVKPNWTYHAKGLWYSMSKNEKPFFTLIGSPNFGYRSVNRDLETQLAILTKNENLQDSLEKEYNHLFNQANPVTSETFQNPERIPPAWVRVVVLFFRYYF